MAEPAYHTRPRREMLRYLPAGARRVLDVGCGAGVFGASVRERGCEVWGLELDPEAVREAAGRLDRVLEGDAVDSVAGLPAGRFDCIYLNDILEHLPEPEPLLRALAPKLTPSGRLVTSMPNVRYFPHLWRLVVRGRWDYADEGILDRTHLRFYTRSSMRALLTSCGYVVERCEGINGTGSRRWRLANLLTLGGCAEMRWLQFACVARVAGTSPDSPPAGDSTGPEAAS